MQESIDTHIIVQEHSSPILDDGPLGDWFSGDISAEHFLTSSLSRKSPISPLRPDLEMTTYENPMLISRTVTIDTLDDDIDNDKAKVREWAQDTIEISFNPACDESLLTNECSTVIFASSRDESTGDCDFIVDAKSTSFTPMHCKSQEETVAAITINDCILKMVRKRRKLKYQIRGCSAINTILNSLIQYAANNHITLVELGSRVIYDKKLVSLVLKAMQRFPESADLQEEATSTLYYLCMFDETCGDTVAASFETIVSAMRRHQHSNVQEEGCAVICTLAADVKYHEQITSKGGITAILSAINQHPRNARILQACFAALCNLASNVSLQKQLGEEGTIAVIVTSMNLHPKNCSIQEYGCAALSNLSLNCKTNQIIIARNNGVAAIVDAMNRDSASFGIQESACAAISNLASSIDKEILGKVRSVGIVSILLVSMKKYMNHESLQEHCCGAISYLTSSLDSLDPEIDNYDAMRTVLTAMRCHAQNPLIQQYGCNILRNVSRNNNSREIISSVGGIGTIIVGMVQQPEDEHVQAYACAALFNLAQNDLDNVVSIASEGGAIAAVEAMRRHVDSALVQREGCRILSYLFMQSDANCAAFISSGVLEVLLSAMNAQQDCPDIFHFALPILKKLSSTGKYHRIFSSTEVVRTILLTMRCHGHDSAIQKLCCSTLENLSRNVEAEKLIKINGGIGTILVAMRLHTNDASIQIYGLKCLYNMSTKLDNQCDLLSEGGLGTILSAMIVHKSADIQLNGCLLFYSLTECSEMIPFLVDQGVIGIVEAAATRITDRYEKRNVHALLKRLKKA